MATNDCTGRRCGRVLTLILLCGLLAASSTLAQTATSSPWAGWARCQIDIQGPGYSEQAIHTWTITGATPSVEGAFRVYAGSWAVVGKGGFQRTQGTQTLTGQWAINGQSASAPIAVLVRPDGRVSIQARHAQLTAAGSVAGYQQQTIDGKSQPPGQVSSPAFEWQFPSIDVGASNTSASGSSTPGVNGSVGFMQPAGSRATASCTWQFAQGAAPPPPSTLAAVAVPSPSSVGGSPVPPSSIVQSPPTAGNGTPQPTNTPTVESPRTTAGGGSPQPAPDLVQPVRTTQTPTQVTTTSLTPVPGSTGGQSATPTAATARDPSNFLARQSGDGTVVLTWDAVTGAGGYLLSGPGTNVGITVNGVSQTLTGIAQGTQTWTLATIYNPGGILTTSDRWSRASATVTNTSGRYRLVLTGFRVNRATFDDRFNGNGDEVYAAVGVVTLDRRDGSVVQPWAVIKSDSYGDTGRNPGYVRAGSFTPTGGLWAGDVVPSGTDPRMASGAPSSSRFPLTVWEGTLRDRVDAVIVKPTLWEIDGPVDYYTQWLTLRDSSGNFKKPSFGAGKVIADNNAQMAILRQRADQSDLTFFRGTTVFDCATYAGAGANLCNSTDDRPIGMNRAACLNYEFEETDLWCDIAAVLTREGVERALSASAQVGGAPPASITMPLIDRAGVDSLSGGLDGSYELYLQIQRLP